MGPTAGLDVSEKRKISYFFMFFAAPTVNDKGKGKVHRRTGHESPGGSRGIALLLLNLDARRGWWSTPHPGRFTPGRDPVPIV